MGNVSSDGLSIIAHEIDQLSQDPKENWWLLEGRVCFMT